MIQIFHASPSPGRRFGLAPVTQGLVTPSPPRQNRHHQTLNFNQPPRQPSPQNTEAQNPSPHGSETSARVPQ